MSDIPQEPMVGLTTKDIEKRLDAWRNVKAQAHRRIESEKSLIESAEHAINYYLNALDNADPFNQGAPTQ